MPSIQKVAAIQMEGRVADLRYHIAQAGDLLEKALRSGAQIIALPEFFTTPIVLDERLFGCSVAAENPALDMLKSLAATHGAMIDGSYLAKRGDDVFNTYVLVDREGAVHTHDKDLPTMVENAYYTGGKDDGLVATSHGSVGIAVCWETIRTATVRRLRGKVDLLMMGSHWWSEPGWRCPRWLMDQTHRDNLAMMAATPSRLSRMIGAPVLHAAHVGTVEGRFAITPNICCGRADIAIPTGGAGKAKLILSRKRPQRFVLPECGLALIIPEGWIGRSAPTVSTISRRCSLQCRMIMSMTATASIIILS